MSDTFGALYIQGQQNFLPGGGVQGIGPFAVPASGVQKTVTQNVPDSTAVPISVPANSQGVILIPPVGGSNSWQYKTVIGDTGIFGNPALPTFLDFDPDNTPNNLYLTSAAGTTIVLQFL